METVQFFGVDMDEHLLSGSTAFGRQAESRTDIFVQRVPTLVVAYND
jgi:hypothetical protein